jgi:uncharacterized protein
MVKSPCINICLIDQKTDLCLGCGRSLIEIEKWTIYSEKEREEIIKKIKKNKLKSVKI